MNNIKTKNFPIGIFIFLLLMLLISSTAVIALYFKINTQEQITKIEKESQKYTTTLISACEQIIYSSKNRKKSKPLEKFFRKSASASLYYKAFYALNDGKIVAHSDAEEKRSLRSNIASDQLTYNLSQIFAPIERKQANVFYNDYNILEKNPPFNKRYLKILKKYIYSKIDITGWLATKAIRSKGKYIGTINIIISKDKVYNAIFKNISFAKINIIRLYIASFILSFVISLLMLIRYQSLKIKILDSEKNIFLTQKYPKQTGSQYGYTAPAPAPAPRPRQRQKPNFENNSFVKKSQQKVMNRPTKVNYIYEDNEYPQQQDQHKHPQDLKVHDAIPIRSRRPR